VPSRSLVASACALALSVLLGLLAAGLALARAQGWITVPRSLPVAFARLGVAGTVALAVFLVALVRHLRSGA
jgi:hypothetical protein